MAPTHDFNEAASRLETLAAESAALAGRFEQAESAARVVVTASDPLEAATATLDESGRVSGVRLHALWQEKVPAAQLAAAVLEAVQAAELRRLELWSEALETASPRPRTAAAPSSTDPPPVVDLAALAEESISLLDALNRRTPPAPADQPAAVAEVEAGKPVRVTLAADGALTHLLIDGTWAGRASLSRLTETLNEAIQAAYEALDAQPAVTSPFPVAVSPELAAVMRDPAGAFRRYIEWRGFDVTANSRGEGA